MMRFGCVGHRAVLAALLAGALFRPAPAADAPELAARSLLLDVQAVGREIIAVGAYGHVLHSTDEGRTWKISVVPTLATLTAVHFPDARHGWAVGHDAQVLHTSDGGQTWTRQYQGPDLDAPLLSILFLDAQRGFAVGAYGQFLSTSDGGRSWIAHRLIEQDCHFNRLTRGPTGTLYLAGEAGTLLRSIDQGATWRPIPAPYHGSFYGVLPLGPEVLLAYGLRGRIYRSEDDGASWQSASAGPEGLLATAVRLRNGVIVLAGQARLFLVSRDGGRTFAPWTAPLTTAVAELMETPGGRLLAAGEAGITILPEP